VILQDAFIREAEPDDARGIIDSIRSVLAEADHNLSNSLEEFNPTEPEERDFIQKVITDVNSLILVAESVTRGEIVGVLTCMGSSRQSRKHTVRLGISVMQGWRGQGIGSRLIEEALRWANKNDTIRRVELEVMVRNQGAVSLYTKLGFQVEGRGIGVVRKDGAYHDVYWMAMTVKYNDKPEPSTETNADAPEG
jgi:ribosomal protein S18 acetylase RimI-like enzyme